MTSTLGVIAGPLATKSSSHHIVAGAIGIAGAPRRPTKQEMVAAIMFGSPTAPEELIDLLRRYGKATVADAFVPSQLSGRY
jgi:hypothetical protein